MWVSCKSLWVVQGFSESGGKVARELDQHSKDLQYLVDVWGDSAVLCIPKLLGPAGCSFQCLLWMKLCISKCELHSILRSSSINCVGANPKFFKSYSGRTLPYSIHNVKYSGYIFENSQKTLQQNIIFKASIWCRSYDTIRGTKSP